MRPFQIGGAATRSIEISSIEASYDTDLKFINRNFVVDTNGKKVVMSRNCEVLFCDDKGNEKSRSSIPYGAKVYFDNAQKVKKGDVIAEWDPYTIPIITEKSGKIVYKDLVEGVSVRDLKDEATGISNKVIVDWKQQTRGADLRPRLVLEDDDGDMMVLSNGLEAR